MLTKTDYFFYIVVPSMIFHSTVLVYAFRNSKLLFNTLLVASLTDPLNLILRHGFNIAEYMGLSHLGFLTYLAIWVSQPSEIISWRLKGAGTVFLIFSFFIMDSILNDPYLISPLYIVFLLIIQGAYWRYTLLKNRKEGQFELAPVIYSFTFFIQVILLILTYVLTLNYFIMFLFGFLKFAVMLFSVLCRDRVFYSQPNIIFSSPTPIYTQEGAFANLNMLSVREREIFELIGEGNTSSQIAEKLFISKRTVDLHRTRLKKKLKTLSHFDLIKLAEHHNYRKIERK